MPLTHEERLSTVHALVATKCACGRAKDYPKSFCTQCREALPPKMRNALSALWGEGFEEAYFAAVAYLTMIGRIPS